MGFIDDYKLFSSGNEAATIFHDWACISVLSSFASRRVWVDQGAWKVHPNMYIIFVGNPGCGKSTAMDIAWEVVRKTGKVPVFSAATTVEKLLQEMGDPEGDCQRPFMYNGVLQECSHVSMFAHEVSTLLGDAPSKMITLLTDIFSRDVYENKTKNKGIDVIVGPFLTICGCMTPETTDQLIKQKLISGGFSRRCVFIYNNTRQEPIPRPVRTQAQVDALGRLVARGQAIQKVAGPFVWTKGAEEFFDSWYHVNHKVISQHMDIATQGYFVTKPAMLLKVGMLLGLSESDDKLLEERHLAAALAMLTATEKSLGRVFMGAGQNKQADLAGKIISLMETKKAAIREKEVYASMFSYGNRDDIRETLDHLVSVGQLIRESFVKAQAMQVWLRTPGVVSVAPSDVQQSSS